ncbi:PEP-CTERM sorting domain-containing protein [Crocosphaera sp. UHCC 0190]|uniref:PEP-CTERM sorting domain-containing protein n=1 Tax=Crocosphaera sp. UHCC 0190 TaxID=3110246 RepID=UPI002B1FF0C8|nr:PEP-CTERM sorting domain-containing protein [Crocosphaera sp. UHCC 0190]MEA5510515.1 PEP-CTERM sorting domain-containing protein [Crocosphaera sp. UHCC 0190]
MGTHSAFAFEFDKKLLAPDGASSDQFGSSVSLSGNTALVGSPYDDDNGSGSGSAYLFDATTGTLLQKLTAPDGAAQDYFGLSVSLSGNTALVGSPYDDDNGSGSGSAYLFDATTGTLLQKLTAPDGASGDYFGISVSLSGNTALVGSRFDDDNGTLSGSAYLFDVTTGTLLQKLTAPDGAANDRFGSSVSLSGNTALVGSPYDDDNGSLSGSAYLFDVTTGTLLQKLTAPDGAGSDFFGSSVSLSGNTALVGSPGDDDNGTLSGSAYLFDVTTGTLLQKLTAPDGAASDFFGSSVSLSGNTALVGSPDDDDNGSLSGSAYLFDVTTGTFLQKLTAPDGAGSDFFGSSVSLSGNTALVGSSYDDDNGSSSGSAYLFTTSQPVPEPLTILGAGTAIGFGASFKRKLAKKNKKQS